MLKRNTVLALGFAALATPWCSAPGVAALAANALAPQRPDAQRRYDQFHDAAWCYSTSKRWPTRKPLPGVG